MVLITIARCPSAIITNFEEKSVLLAGPRVYQAHQGPHGKVAGSKKESTGLGVQILLGSRVEA